jgi:hypothetical protein
MIGENAMAIMPVDEMPKLEPELAEKRSLAQARSRARAGLRLKALAQHVAVERIFGTELATHLATLSSYDARNGVLVPQNHTSLQAVVEAVNTTGRGTLGLSEDVIRASELEAALTSGDPSSLAYGAASRLAAWKASQPAATLTAWERWRWASGNLLEETAGTQKVMAFLPGATFSIIGTYEGVVAVVDALNELIDAFCGPDYEMHADAILQRESHLHVPWRGFEIGNNNQEFTAQYTVNVLSGSVEMLDVEFRIDLSGSGFDSLGYPLEVFASTTDGSLPTITPIRTTRYQQKHQVVARNVRLLVIGVVGRVQYGTDGFMTDAGLVPSGWVTASGRRTQFGGGGDSIWKYGISV